VVVLSALVVFLQQIVNLSTFHFSHLLVQFILKFFENFSLAKSLADASDSADVFTVFLSCDEIQLILFDALSMKMFLVLECFEHVFEANLRGRRWLGARRFSSQGFNLTQILIKLAVGLIDVCVLTRWISSKLFLELPDEIDQSAGSTPCKNPVEFDLTGHVFNQRVGDPFGDIHQWLVFWEGSQQNTMSR